MLLLELITSIIGIAIVVWFTYYIARKLVQIICKTDEEEAGRIIANLFYDNKYDITSDFSFQSTLVSEIYDLMDETEIVDLMKYLRMNSLIQYSSNGFRCINIFLRIDAEKREVAEKRFRNLLEENLSVHGIHSEVLVDWKFYDKNLDYLQLRYATNKTEQEHIQRCNEIERKRIVKKYKPLEDDDVEIKE